MVLGVAEIVVRKLQKAKPGHWGCVQARKLWSSKEETHLAAVRHTTLLFCLTKAEVILEVVRTMSAVLVLKVDL